VRVEGQVPKWPKADNKSSARKGAGCLSAQGPSRDRSDESLEATGYTGKNGVGHHI
jgi:hypothetical protein